MSGVRTESFGWRITANVAALINRIGFGRIFYYDYNKKPPTILSAIILAPMLKQDRNESKSQSCDPRRIPQNQHGSRPIQKCPHTHDGLCPSDVVSLVNARDV